MRRLSDDRGSVVVIIVVFGTHTFPFAAKVKRQPPVRSSQVRRVIL